ncbi:histidine phosphatase family protein [Comamonas humi]
MQSPTRIIAIRHGETAWNVDGRIQGHTDIPLNAKGEWQAGQVAAALADEPLAAIYSSDLSRAWVTAQAIAASNRAPLTAEPALRERSFGIFEGRSFADIAVSHPDDATRWRQRDPDYTPPEGESLQTLQQRASAAVDRLAVRHPGQQIALVAHGGLLDMLYRLATRQPLQAPRTWALGNAAINRLLWTPDTGLTLVGWADARHLEAPGLDEQAA